MSKASKSSISTRSHNRSKVSSSPSSTGHSSKRRSPAGPPQALQSAPAKSKGPAKVGQWYLSNCPSMAKISAPRLASASANQCTWRLAKAAASTSGVGSSVGPGLLPRSMPTESSPSKAGTTPPQSLLPPPVAGGCASEAVTKLGCPSSVSCSRSAQTWARRPRGRGSPARSFACKSSVASLAGWLTSAGMAAAASGAASGAALGEAAGEPSGDGLGRALASSLQASAVLIAGVLSSTWHRPFIRSSHLCKSRSLVRPRAAAASGGPSLAASEVL
mmetsp:Transcript_58603/g.188385  ORF Transcript_58603/g.188385 Transcript_58603/m.188385 type:complete len:275 (-) Transcript_58603:564-1388(-)